MGARSIEAVLLGLAGWLALVATAVWQGTPGPSAFLAALLGAAAAAAAFWLGARIERAELARRIDGRLACQGELLTAYECSTRSAPPALAPVLAAGLCERLSPSEILRAGSSAFLSFLTLPLLALALLALARERSTGESEADWIVRLSRDLEYELARARDAGEQALAQGELDAGELAQIVAAEARAGAAAQDLKQGSAGAEQVRAAAEEIGSLLRELGTEILPGSALAQAVDRARESAEAAALGLGGNTEEPGRAGPGSEAAGSEASAEPTETALAGGSSGAPGTVDAGETERRAAAGLENGTSSGTMSASQTEKPHPPAGSLPGADPSHPGASGGVAAGRSWRAHQAEIVERWIEARRKASLHDRDPDPTSEGE